MIAPGTVCLIVHAPLYPECLGLECTITGHDPRPRLPYHFAVLRDGRTCRGAERCFLPISPYSLRLATTREGLTA